MKASKVVLSALFAGLASYAAAQEFVPIDGYSIEPGYKTHFRHNKAGDNWFVSVAGGVNLFYGDRSMEAGLLNQYSIIPQISFGKWFNPYLAFRVQALGGGVISPLDLDGNYKQGGNFAAGHADILLDVTNLWAPYNEKRLFRLIPWLGLGYTQRFRVAAPEGFTPDMVTDYALQISPEGEFPRSESPTLNAGILTAFRLTQRLDLNIEVQGSLMNETFNRMSGKQLSDALVQGTVGLTWEFGKPTFQVLEPKDYAQLNEMNDRINALREENNDLRDENGQLRKRPVSCPECPPASKTTVQQVYKGADQVVYFRLNSSTVEPNQHVALFTLADFVTKHNTPIIVTGFADRKTGSTKYNSMLSEKRAKAVTDILAEKFSVPRSLITTSWKGGDEQPYAEDEWNRSVIIKMAE